MERMSHSIDFLKENDSARTAFQMANEAITIQRKWLKGEEDLVWRPFQLAFQLQVLASLLEVHDNDVEFDVDRFVVKGAPEKFKTMKEIKPRKHMMEEMGAAFMAEGIVSLAGSRLYTSMADTDDVIDDALARFDNVLSSVEGV